MASGGIQNSRFHSPAFVVAHFLPSAAERLYLRLTRSRLAEYHRAGVLYGAGGWEVCVQVRVR